MGLVRIQPFVKPLNNTIINCNFVEISSFHFALVNNRVADYL